MWRRSVGLGLGGNLLLASTVLAKVGAGSSRVPLTDWLIELYNVTDNVFVPVICLAVLVVGAANLAFGFMRFGPVIGKIFAVVGILGLGVTFFAQTIGAKLAVAVLWP